MRTASYEHTTTMPVCPASGASKGHKLGYIQSTQTFLDLQQVVRAWVLTHSIKLHTQENTLVTKKLSFCCEGHAVEVKLEAEFVINSDNVTVYGLCRLLLCLPAIYHELVCSSRLRTE